MRQRARRWLSVLLSLAMVLGLSPGMPVTALADEGHIHDGIEFIAWGSETGLPTGAGNYYLTHDVVIDGTWTVPEGLTRLCLNGHGIRTTGNYNVITVLNATLELYDCDTRQHGYTVDGNGLATVYDNATYGDETFNGGYITGGKNGGVRITTSGKFRDSNLFMYGGTIIGNTATNGGGVFVTAGAESGGEFKMLGGAIIGNTASNNGGGVFNNNCNGWCVSAMFGGTITSNNAGNYGGGVYGGGGDAEVRLSGSPTISGNNIGSEESNVYLCDGKAIGVYGALTDDAAIGVTMSFPGVFTSGLNGRLPDGKTAGDVFSSDDNAYIVTATAGGEAQLEPHHHEFSYSSDGGGTITATCSALGCPLENGQATLTIGAPTTGLNYDGGAKEAVVTGDTDVLGTPDIAYIKDGVATGTPTEAGDYTASITVGGATASVGYVISPKPVTITGLTASGKVYDGTTEATVAGEVIVDGIIDGDDVTITGGTAAFENANAGTGKAVTFSGYALSGADAGNYILTGQPAATTANITKKPVTITGLTASDKVYDGTTAATASGTAIVDGKVGDDDVYVTGGTAAFENSNAGNGKAVTFSGYVLSGADAGNYMLTGQPATTTADITARPVTVTAKPQTVAVGDDIDRGTEQAELTGAVGGHALTAVTLTASSTSAATTTGTITPSAATIGSGGTDVTENYEVTYVDGVLTVTAPVTYTVTISKDEGCDVSVVAGYTEEDGGTQVSSGDSLPYGTVLTVTATARPGYELTMTPAASYTVDGDLTIKAASKKRTYALTLIHENGAAPTRTYTGDLAAVPHGTEVAVTAGSADAGYEFVGWYQANRVRLTGDESYTVTVSADTTLEARYQKTEGVVTFMANGQEQGTFAGGTITDAAFPPEPSAANGMEFDRWDKGVDEINAELRQGRNVTVTAVFAKIQSEFTVTVYNGEATVPETVNCTQTTTVTRRAAPVDGKAFAWWELDGERISYSSTASFFATQDCVLRAVYASTAVEAEGTATIRTITYNLDTKKLSFNAYLTVPDGAKITAAGLVAASGAGSYDPDEPLTEANAEYTKALAAATGRCAPVDYTWNKTKVNPGDVWYVRARIVYTDAVGVEHEVYGERLRVAAGTDYDVSEMGTATIRRFSYNEGAKKLSFNAYLTVPDDATIVKAGLVAVGPGFNPATQVLTASNAAYVKSLKDAEGKCAPVDYTWNKTKVEKGDTWYARAYLVYTDSAGRQHTVYGELITAVAN